MSLMSNVAIAASLRRLADVVARDPGVTATVETETIGRAVKTTVTLWSFAPDAVPEPCKALAHRDTGPLFRACGRPLNADGSCPTADRHARLR